MLQLHDLQTELMEVLHPLLKGGILRPGGLMIVTFKFGSGYTEETWDRMAAQQAAQVRCRPLDVDVPLIWMLVPPKGYLLVWKIDVDCVRVN